jgi:hypothetical protein
MKKGASPYNRLWSQFGFIKHIRDQLDTNSDFALYNKNGEIIFDHKTLEDFVSSMIYTFSFDKEMGDLGPSRDETKEIDLYYKEREWRLVPSNIDLATEIFDEQNNVMYYKFKRTDVNMIVVPNEEMRAAVLDYFLKLPDEADDRLIQFRENPLPIIHYDDLQKW